MELTKTLLWFRENVISNNKNQLGMMPLFYLVKNLEEFWEEIWNAPRSWGYKTILMTSFSGNVANIYFLSDHFLGISLGILRFPECVGCFRCVWVCVSECSVLCVLSDSMCGKIKCLSVRLGCTRSKLLTKSYFKIL